MSEFSKRLIALRKEQGMSQTDLADLVNRKRSTISGYEVEGKEPDIDTVCSFASIFGVSTDYLLGYSPERNHVETVFYNDHCNFKEHLSSLPADLQQYVALCFDSLYRLLDPDVQLSRPDRLSVYADFFSALASLRSSVCSIVDGSSGSVDPLALSDLMTAQSSLKYKASEYLDKLLQADMEIAFDLQEKDVSESPGATAM